jgi:signal transduction histidine kinase
VHVSVETNGDRAQLLVTDDGRGFDGPVDEGHLGLRVLADLAREAGGDMQVNTRPQGGTRVCIEAPL